MDILINLLPPSEKGEIKNLRRIGVILKIGFSAFCALVTFVCFLFFTMKIIGIQEETVAREISRFEQSEAYKETKEFQETLREYNKTASKVKSGLSKQQSHWGIISQINEIVPENIKLIEFSVDKDGILFLKGIAYDREALLNLKSGLEESDKVEKVEFPISNFVANKDVEFEFTASVK